MPMPEQDEGDDTNADAKREREGDDTNADAERERGR